MSICEFCNQEIPWKAVKTHECDEYLHHLDNERAASVLREEAIRDTRLFFLKDDFTIEQSLAIIDLVEHMILEET